MHGHAGHRDWLAARLAAARQRDVDELRGAPRVIVEELVEVAHAVEQQRVGKPRLDGVVLLHDGRVLLRAQDGTDLFLKGYRFIFCFGQPDFRLAWTRSTDDSAAFLSTEVPQCRRRREW